MTLIKTTLKNPELLHVRHCQDIELVQALGLSIRSVAFLMGYTSPNTIYKQLRHYRETGDYLSIKLSMTFEAALWRSGSMARYIKARQIQDPKSINWDRLPKDLKPWE